MTHDILKLFHAREGTVCFVGAGGKKTAMYRLAREHHGRVGLTTSAHIEHFPRSLEASRYVVEEDALLPLLKNDMDSRIIAFATPFTRAGHHAGINPERMAEFRTAGRFDLLLIKADGARGRYIKAPKESEPPLPVADTVIPVVSARAIGKALSDKVAHRLEQLSKVTGVQPDEIIEPKHVARLLAAEDGALKNVGSARVVPLINMVDDERQRQQARVAAELALQLTDRFEYVVLGTMRAEQPIVEVVHRR